MTHFLAGVTGLLAGLIPPLAGLGVLLDPLRRKSGYGKAVRVASLAGLPADGIPRRFSVTTDRTDAWNQLRNVPVGAVYLRRTSETEIQAFNVSCPHAGCSVDYREDENNFLCPCHNSRFNLDGSIKNPDSPSPRGLYNLAVELRNDDEVWVEFKKGDAHTEETQPTA